MKVASESLLCEKKSEGNELKSSCHLKLTLFFSVEMLELFLNLSVEKLRSKLLTARNSVG